MANTYDADLIVSVLSNRVVNVLPNMFAPVDAFSTDFSDTEVAQDGTLQITKVTGGSTTLENPSDFESGDSTTSNIPVTVKHYSQPFHISSKDANNKLRLEKLAFANLKAFSEKINGLWTGLVLAATFTNAGATVAQASFAAANAKALRGQIGKVSSKNLLLDSVAFAQLAPTDRNGFDLAQKGAYGFDRIIEATLWTGATANTYGVACGPEAIGLVTGIPEQVPGLGSALLSSTNITLPNGMVVQQNMWVSTKTRALWCSYDIMAGAVVIDASALSIIKSA